MLTLHKQLYSKCQNSRVGISVIKTLHQTLTLNITAAASLITANCQFSSVVCQPNRNDTKSVFYSSITEVVDVDHKMEMSQGSFGVSNHGNMSRWFGKILRQVSDKPVCVVLMANEHDMT